MLGGQGPTSATRRAGQRHSRTRPRAEASSGDNAHRAVAPSLPCGSDTAARCQQRSRERFQRGPSRVEKALLLSSPASRARATAGMCKASRWFGVPSHSLPGIENFVLFISLDYQARCGAPSSRLPRSRARSASSQAGGPGLPYVPPGRPQAPPASTRPSRHPDPRERAQAQRWAGPRRAPGRIFPPLPVGHAGGRAFPRSMQGAGAAGRLEQPAVAAQRQPRRRAGSQAAPRGCGHGGEPGSWVVSACGRASCVFGRHSAGRVGGGRLPCAMRCTSWSYLARTKG